MNSELAERLLREVVGWPVGDFGILVQDLQALAAVKYDGYGNYRPGVKFVETLAVWLDQLEPQDRQPALDFVLSRLVYISDAELEHLIDLAYPDHLLPGLLRRTANAVGRPEHRVAQLMGDPAFRAAQRRLLILGMSDGARLDRLRRASRLSHEQFAAYYLVGDEQLTVMRDKLVLALEELGLDAPATFSDVLLVDDFSGSGYTIAHEGMDGRLDGRTGKFARQLEQWIERGWVESDATVTILLYVASEVAVDRIRQCLRSAGLAWALEVVQELPARLRVSDTSPEIAELCRKYYDERTLDEHKRKAPGALEEAPLGFGGVELPLVLAQNTPNNSICLLWSHSIEDFGDGCHALFPRYERHHRDRP